MVKPASSVDNLTAALFYRVVNIENTVCAPSSNAQVIKLIPLIGFSYVPNPDWFSSLRFNQRARISRALKEIEEHGSCNKETSVFVKSAEFLSTFEKSIPRVIFNISSYYLHLLGDFVEQLSHHLAQNIFPRDPKLFTIINGKSIYVFFTCGARSTELDNFVNKALASPPGIYIMVMGDDTMAIDTTGPRPKYIETDYSKFDRTQNNTVLNWFYEFLNLNGFNEFTKIWEDMYKQKIVPRHRKTGIKLSLSGKEQMLLTGEMGTCVRNSLTNIFVSSIALAYNDQNFYSSVGFKVKYRESDKLDVTFLRGVFLKGTDDCYHWTRLPSFILKFGKTFTDPHDVFPRHWSRERADAQMCYSQWLGYGHPNNWFTQFIHFQVERICHGSQFQLIKNEYAVFGDSLTDIPDDIFDEFIYDRYKLTRDDLEHYLLSYLKIEEVGVAITHPVLNILEKRDY
jgi:hypothetical protein